MQAYISSLESPAVQRNMLRALRHFLKFASAAGLIDDDPAEGVTREGWPRPAASSPGPRRMSRNSRRAIRSAQRRGWRSRCISISGFARSDVVRIGPRHIRNGELTDFQPQKTSRTGGKLITVPLHPGDQG